MWSSKYPKECFWMLWWLVQEFKAGLKDITKSEIIKANNEFLAVTKLDFKSLYLNNLLTKLVPESQKSCITLTIMFADKKTWLGMIYNNTCFAKSWGARLKAKYGISRAKWGVLTYNSRNIKPIKNVRLIPSRALGADGRRIF